MDSAIPTSHRDRCKLGRIHRGYYVDIKDASTNFFFDHLGKGVYVLEYGYRVSREGTYETGLVTIQCAYAPEYVSHSASMTIIIE